MMSKLRGNATHAMSKIGGVLMIAAFLTSLFSTN
jgi:hypothetical protein